MSKGFIFVQKRNRSSKAGHQLPICSGEPFTWGKACILDIIGLHVSSAPDSTSDQTYSLREGAARLEHHLSRAEAHSLAAVMASTPESDRAAPLQQVPQWLFAFDPAGMATFRALALLAAHPGHAARAQEEISAHPGPARRYLPYLRATILGALRLWPTTPLVLRQSTAPTTWDTGYMPSNTGILIFAPFFHRDDQRLPFAHRFAPEIWLQEKHDQGSPPEKWPLIPFSGGPAICPGRNLVLLLTSAMLASLADGHEIRLKPATRLAAAQPLPGTLNNYSLRFELRS